MTQIAQKKEQAKPKDAYTMIQEQMRAEQAKQPQNQFEHQENILKQLNSDEVHNKLLKIFHEREELYSQMEHDKKSEMMVNNSASQRHSHSAKDGKNLSGDTIQGHNDDNIKVNPY